MKTPELNRISGITRLILVALCAGLLFLTGEQTSGAEPEEHPLVPALGHARLCLEKAEEIPAYEVTFAKREVVGRTMISQQVRMKVRHKPFSVYMYFEKPSEGREVIYVDGLNENNLLVHESGLKSLIGTLKLSPTGSEVMAENRYPVTKAGIANMVRAVIDQWEQETQFGETDVNYYKDAKVGTYTCRMIESTHPQPRRQFKFHRTRLWIDNASGLAVRVQQAGFPSAGGADPPILEDYTFSGIRTDVRLTDRDFDTRNPNYRFR